MSTVVEFLSTDHRHCDAIFAAAEEAADAGNLALWQECFQQLRTALKCHFKREEEALFPVFEQVTLPRALLTRSWWMHVAWNRRSRWNG